MLTNTTNVDRYLINGTPLSTYAIHFPYWDKEEINVYLTNSDGSLSTLTEGTNYTLSTPNGTNGTLTRVGDWTAGATNLTIIREMSLTQEVDLRNGDKIDAETLETALDNLTAQVQQLAETQSRAVVSSVDEAGSNLAIPNKASRIGSGSGTMMGFGSDGESIVLRDLAGFDADVASAASNASSASSSAGTATTQALKSEGYAVGEQNGSPVTSGSPYYQNNSKYYAQVAKAGADVITDNLTAITNLDNNMSDINDVADDLANIDAVAGDLTNIDSVADDLTNIDAVNSNKTNIDTVAGIESDVTTVAGISSDVTTVAGATSDIAAILPDISDVSAVAADLTKVTAVADDLTNIDTVEADLTNVDTVAGSISNVNAVGGNITNVNAVAGNSTNINAVNSNKTNIDTVAGKASDITTVAGIASDVTTVAGIAADVSAVEAIDTDVTTVAGIASDVSAVAAIDDDVSAVASNETNINTVATDIADVSTVASDMTKVTAVADDLTNIDAVADDLTNIDNAVNYALEAEGFAVGEQNGTPVSSGSPYYQNNAKYYSQEVPALKDAISFNRKRIENLEQKSGSVVDVDYPDYSVYGEVPTGKAKNAIVSKLRGVAVAWNVQVKNGNFYPDTSNWEGLLTSLSASQNKLTATVTASLDNYALVQQRSVVYKTGHKYLVSCDYDCSGISNFAGFVIRIFADPNEIYRSGTIKGTATAITSITTGTTSGRIQIGSLTSSAPVINDSLTLANVECYDLTQMFGSSVANYLYTLEQGTAGAGVALFKALVSALDNSAESGKLVSTTYSAVKSKKDFFDQQMELGMYNDTTGAKESSSNRLRSVNRQPCTPNTTYYFDSPTNAYGYGYDANGNYLGSYFNMTANSNFTTPNNCHSFAFYVTTQYGTTYGNDIHVIGELDTLTLPTSVTLRGILKVDNGNLVVDGDEYDPETGEIERRYGYKDLGTLAWTYDSTNRRFLASLTMKAGNTRTIQVLCAKYDCLFGNEPYDDSWDKVIYAGSDTVVIHDRTYDGDDLIGTTAPFLQGVYLVYPLASITPDTPVTPINDPTLSTEGGGTLSTTQTNDPAIVSAMEMTYMTL